MKNKSQEIFLKNYGALILTVGIVALIVACAIIGCSGVDYIRLSAVADGSHGSGIGIFFTLLVGICGLLIFPPAIYYCGRRMLELRYTLRRVKIHAVIILVLALLQIALAIWTIGLNVLLDASFLSILLLVVSITLAILSIACFVVCWK